MMSSNKEDDNFSITNSDKWIGETFQLYQRYNVFRNTLIDKVHTFVDEFYKEQFKINRSTQTQLHFQAQNKKINDFVMHLEREFIQAIQQIFELWSKQINNFLNTYKENDTEKNEKYRNSSRAYDYAQNDFNQLVNTFLEYTIPSIRSKFILDDMSILNPGSILSRESRQDILRLNKQARLAVDERKREIERTLFEKSTTVEGKIMESAEKYRQRVAEIIGEMKFIYDNKTIESGRFLTENSKLLQIGANINTYSQIGEFGNPRFDLSSLRQFNTQILQPASISLNRQFSSINDPNFVNMMLQKKRIELETLLRDKENRK